jgi:HAD superfamily hydrolase (TIGR01509 family)
LTPSSRFSAIIFDCDGVLVDSEVIAIEVELAALADAGLTYELGEYKLRFMGTSTAAFYAALEQDCRLRNGSGLPTDFREKCRALYRAAAHRLAEVPGARKAIAALLRPKAVASSSTAEALSEKLRVAGLWDLFAPHIYSADHVTHAKPGPDLFLHAANALCVEPARCLVLEDSANGVIAARAAGMTVWGFTGGGHMDDVTASRLLAAGAERLVPNWSRAGELFRALT